MEEKKNDRKIGVNTSSGAKKVSRVERERKDGTAAQTAKKSVTKQAEADGLRERLCHSYPLPARRSIG